MIVEGGGMGRYSGTTSYHYMRLRLRWDGLREWIGVSEWDRYYEGDRLRYPQSRSTVYWDERSARRWARRYKVDFPTEPENPRKEG
jgi:hypothetical protein